MYEQSNGWTAVEVPAECIASFGGIFSFILLVALPLAVLLTWVTVRLYRRKISKVMRQVSAGEMGQREVELSDGSPPSNPLSIEVISDKFGFDETEASVVASRRLKASSRGYALAGLSQAVVVTGLTFILSNTEFLLVRFSSTVFLYLWPIVPTLILTSVGDPRVKWGSIAGYFGALAVLDWWLVATGIMQGSGQGSLALVWLTWMGPPSVLLLVLSNRAWRSVGLLAYLVAVALVTGWLIATQGLACLALALNDVALWADYRWPALIAALVLAGGFAWWLLKRVARKYQEKRLSDQSLTLDSWWFVITMVEVVIQFDSTDGLSVSFFLAYAVYLWASRRLSSLDSAEATSSMLLLRVFGYRRRSRKLLDQLSQRWRFLGPISLIGAPDVAATNLEPDELIQFWGGRGGDSFISGSDDVRDRLKSFDNHPDPDGRFRINEFFCYENTWRGTVKALAETSDVILMDLRGFGPDNRGCEFELGLLLSDVPLSKTVLLVDSSTDRSVLEGLLHQLWSTIPDSSPNRELLDPKLRVFEASGPVHSVKPLLSLLTAQ